MAAPDYVPNDPTQKPRTYQSPPRRPDGWRADRPGDIGGPQPKGQALGTAGPDQGYAYKLVRHLEDRLHLGDIGRDDAVAGCVALAMKRAGLMGRAPVIHDLTAAFTIYGFLDPSPAAELSEMRRDSFAEIRSHHHYSERRHVVDQVPEGVLRKSHTEIGQMYNADWSSLFEAADHS